MRCLCSPVTQGCSGHELWMSKLPTDDEGTGTVCSFTCGLRGGVVQSAQGRWGGGCGTFADVALDAAEGSCNKGHWF